MYRRAIFFACLFFVALACPAAEDERWLEVRSPHFAVISNADDKLSRQAAAQFEQFREVFRAAMPGFRVNSGTALVILAVKDEKTLRAFLPEFWERKGAVRPVGFFLRGMGKDYVALRLDAPGDLPYHVIYHEYAHNLLKLNYGIVPCWLNEGLAEVFAHTTVNSREATVGLPGAPQLALLRRSQLLPLETLFAVDYDSPYYTEENKTTTFYSESWALAHLLMMASNGERRPQITEYLRLLENDRPALDAAKQAFGDLSVLARQLSEYIHQSNFNTLKVPARPTADEASYSVREIPLAESLAIRADFLLHNDRYADARKLLDDALWLKPDLALANESMGFLLYRQGDRAGAEKWFATAAELDSQNVLAHYYHALAMAREGEDIGDFDATEKHLRRAIELNPEFAPAYSLLAVAYATQDTKLDEALRLARRAVELEPGNIHFQLRVGAVLLRLATHADVPAEGTEALAASARRVDEARHIAQLAAAAAKNADERAAATEFLEQIQKTEQFIAQRNKFQAQLAAEQKALDERRLQRAAQAANPPVPTPEPAPADVNRAVEGTIASANCSGATSLDLTIENAAGRQTLLHSENFTAIEFSGADWQPPKDFHPCKHLAGLRAKIIYRAAAPDKPFAGEILAIEVRK